MMDLTALSDADFSALQRGDLKSMSEAGFSSLIQAQSAAMPREVKLANRQYAAKEKHFSDILGSMSTGEKFAAGMGKHFSDIGTAVKQAIPGSSVTRQTVDETRALEAPLMQTTPARVGYMAGAVSTGLPAAMLPGAGSLIGAAAYGGGLGALTPVGEGESVASNAGLGALGGVAGNALGRATSQAIAPTMNKPAAAMVGNGITLTPGQRLGGGWKRAEDAMTSMPVIGDSIKSAQRRSFEEFNAAIADRALTKIGGKLPPGTMGREAVAYTEKALGDAYESAINRIGSVRADPQFVSDIGKLQTMLKASPMPKDVQAQFVKVVNSQMLGKFQGQGAITGRTFKEMESEIGRLATRYGADASVDKQLLGDALQEAQAMLRGLLERSAGPDLAKDVKAVNSGWAEFKRMQRAAGMVGAKEGVFSPEQYMSAVKALDKSKDKGAFARGSALGMDIADPAVKAMGSTVPDSGTPFRTLMANPVQGAVSTAIGSPLMALYSRPAQNALQMLMSGQRPALATKAAAELQMAAPTLSALGITGANVYQRTPR
jgi:hypothetical protein